MLVLLELRADLRLLGFQEHPLRRHGHPPPAGQAGENYSVIVHNRPGGKLQLDGLPRASEVCLEQLIGDGHAGIACHPQHRAPRPVLLPSVGGVVEITELCLDASIFPDRPVALLVAPARAGQVQGKPLRLGFQLDVGRRDFQGEGTSHFP